MTNQIKHVRKIAILVFVFATILTLAACGRSTGTPYGDVGDDPYLTVGDVIITERELYEELRLQGASVLAQMVDELIFADQITSVTSLLNQGDESLNEFLDEVINQTIHQSADEDTLEKLFNDNPDRFYRNIEQFVDSLYLLDNTVDITTTYNQIVNLANTQDTPYSGYGSIPAMIDQFVLRVAQRDFARGLLEDEVVDEDHVNFISEANLVSRYISTRQGRYDVDALVVRFINLNEANAALYQQGIKADSRGFWYQIPDIRISNEADPNYVDVEDQALYGHVNSILSDLGILGKVIEDRANISLLDYQNYYQRYVISTNRNNGLPDVVLTTAQVKENFVAIYNLLNPAAQVEIANDGSIVGANDTEFDSTYTYDDLTAINTSLRSHIYTTLTAEDQVDLEDSTSGRPYSSRVQTFGNSRFLVFKLTDDSASEEGILVEDSEDETVKVFANTTEANAIKDELFEELLVARLTNQYISAKISELYEENDLSIYDPVVRAFYEQSFGYEGDTKPIDDETVAQVGDNKISVRAFYNRLEGSFGINLALDLASNIFLVNEGKYEVSSTDRAEFESQFKDIIEQFSNNQFASAGYPASMGREQFLLLAFGATTNQQAIDKIFTYPELRQQYIDDIERHYDFEGYTIYEKFADLAALQYNNFKSISVSHMLIYFDPDGNGTPDNPQEYLDTLSAQGQQDVLDGLLELSELIYELVGNYKGFAEGFTAIANEFNNSGRIERGSLVAPIDYQIELQWAKYRQLGFYLRFENIGNPITNSSNFTGFIQRQGTLDKVFFDRALEIHGILSEQDDDDSKFPYLDFYDTGITAGDLEQVQSAFGWHLILATNVSKPNSAIFSASDDEDGRYVSGSDDTLNVYNEDSDTITPSQIKYFITEEKSDEGVTLPAAVQAAFNSNLNPVFTRFNSTYMQRELVFKLLEDVVFADTNDVNRFETIRQINRRQLSEYILSDVAYFDNNYNQLYGSWFDILEATNKA
ncbi:MAG: hypothetical protein ACNA7K_01435 [Acholeplasmataceae bacterium]